MLQKLCKAAIFDVDGTLVDSVDLHARAWIEALAEFGHSVEFAALRQQIGKGGDQLLQEFLSKEEQEQIGEKLEKRRGKLFEERYLDKVQGFPQVRALFERLKADGRQIVLASSAASDELEVYKKRAEIADLIEDATAGDDVEKSKPHPDIFQSALEKLDGVGADEALVIGDTPWDAISAKRAGLKTIGVLCGGFPEAELRGAGCARVYRDPADLLLHYGEWIAGS